MSILCNRPQIIALYAITMASGSMSKIDILDQNSIETIRIRVSEEGFEFEYDLPVHGGYIIKSTAIHY